jgi:hypothetical protein
MAHAPTSLLPEGNELRMHRVLTAVLSLAMVCLLPQLAPAVLISTGDGSGNTTAPANDPGFANVVSTWGRTGSAVYLGDGWMLTDNHVGASTTWINGVSYGVVPGSAHQMMNTPGSTFTQFADVLLYQINGRPNLPALQIAKSAPQFGQAVTMIGNGRDRDVDQSYFTVLDGVWTQVPSSVPHAYTGYEWGDTNRVRWGTNKVDGVGFPQGSGTTQNVSFSMSFSSTNPTAFEAIGTAGDSGGGVFSYNTTTKGWELIGLMSAYTQFSGEPVNLSVFGNMTYASQLSSYRDQILSYLTPGDVNGDGRVDVQDITKVANNWMKTTPTGDANHDGVVNVQDVTYIANHWGFGGGAEVNLTGVPEPETYGLAIAALASFVPFVLRRISRRRSRAECGSRSTP